MPKRKKSRRAGDKQVENPAGFLATHDLKERGWTARMIAQFLGEHDRTRANGLKMGRRRLPPVKLYAQERVEEAERAETFILARFKAEEAREKRVVAREKRLRERALLLQSAAESYAPQPTPQPIRKGAVRKAREPHLGELERKLEALRGELGGLKAGEEAKLRGLLLARLHAALARVYKWYTDPSTLPPPKAKAEAHGKGAGAAQPSDWREWDWE